MQSVFLSYSFQNEREPLLVTLRSIIEAVGFRVVDGRILDSGTVADGVRQKLSECSAIVCVMSPEALATHWVTVELAQAIGANLSVCLLLDDQCALPNPFIGRTTYKYSSADPLQVIANVAALLGMWRQDAGSTARALLLPPDVGQAAINQNADCKYRCIDDISADETDWEPARLVNFVMGVQAILPKVPANHSVQVRLEYGGTIKLSQYTPQRLALEFP